jgi:hypothetical protein
MRLKLLAPFTTRGFGVRSEMPVHDPVGYTEFWDLVEASFGEQRAGLRWSRQAELRFAHAGRYAGCTTNRYRTLESDSLIRPLHVLEIVVGLDAETASRLLGEASDAALQRDGLAGPPGPFHERMRRFAGELNEMLRAAPPAALVRVYDHGVSLVEVDLPVGRLLFDPAVGHEDALDHLQHTGIEFADRLVAHCREVVLAPFFRWLTTGASGARRYLCEVAAAPEDDAPADRTGCGRDAGVLWVTRTLVFDEHHAPADPAPEFPERRAGLIRHWLKDVQRPKGVDVVGQAVAQSTAHTTHWLNYLFREESYEGGYPVHGWEDGGGLARAFCRPWEAVINSQYYYAAFDLLQTRIQRALARSHAEQAAGQIREFKTELDEIVKESNLMVLDYQENFKYYQRTVHREMTAILERWGFESVLLEQIDRGVRACNERVTELHKRASARSSVYTDLILLSIGVTSVFSILLGLLEYGRQLVRDASLVTYEQDSFNFVGWIAAHSTDGILLVAFILSAGLVALYFHFKRQQLI